MTPADAVTFDELSELIRMELRKGTYQMPYDSLPYETKSKVIAQALVTAGVVTTSDAK